MKNLSDLIMADLLSNVDEDYRKNSYKYFKEDVKIIGVRSEKRKEIFKKYWPNFKNAEKKFMLEFCELFLEKGYNETIAFALEIARKRNFFEKSDFSLIEKWLSKYIKNWGSCDDFSVHILGRFIKNNPEFVDTMLIWARKKDRWYKRASAVAFVKISREEKFLKYAFKIADILLEDEDDLVRKGYGWMLKEAANFHLNDVFNYVIKNKSKMPRTALRYAIEKMPKNMKMEAMSK